MLFLLFGKILEKNAVPTEWKKGYLIKLPKIEIWQSVFNLSIPGKVFNRVLLNRFKETVDPHLRGYQTGFRSPICATSWSSHWNGIRHFTSILQTTERQLTALTRKVFWSCGGTTKYLKRLPASFRTDLTCSAVHKGRLTDAFPVRTDVRRGWLLLPFLFILVIDWITKISTVQKRYGIRWTSQLQMDDLDFAHYLALLFHTQQQMQEKTNIVAEHSVRLGLNIHWGKSKILKSELNCCHSFSHAGRESDRRGRTLHISGERRELTGWDSSIR